MHATRHSNGCACVVRTQALLDSSLRSTLAYKAMATTADKSAAMIATPPEAVAVQAALSKHGVLRFAGGGHLFPGAIC